MLHDLEVELVMDIEEGSLSVGGGEDGYQLSSLGITVPGGDPQLALVDVRAQLLRRQRIQGKVN